MWDFLTVSPIDLFYYIPNKTQKHKDYTGQDNTNTNST